MTTFDAFLKRHERRNWSPVFNGLLESMIQNEDLPTAMRAQAWYLRTSWGNHSDICVDRLGGKELRLKDCAQKLRVSPQAISDVFKLFEETHLVTFEGHTIFPVDDPAEAENSAIALDNSPYLSENYEEKAKLDTFTAWIEDVVKTEAPDEYRLYQEIEQARREIRASLLNRWRAFKNKSEGSGEIDTPEAEKVRGVQVKKSEGSGAPSLLGSKHLKPESGAPPPPPTQTRLFPSPDEHATVSEALARYEHPERNDVRLLFAACRRADPQATAAGIAQVIHQKYGAKWRGPGLALFLQNVPKCAPFPRAEPEPAAAPLDPIDSDPEAQIAIYENLIAVSATHPQIEQWRAHLNDLKRSRKPKTKGAGAGV